MKKILLFVAVIMFFAACATKQERAERDAKLQETVAEAIAQRQWHIDITLMNTLRYGSRVVTPDFFLELRGDTLCSYLPYLGDVYMPNIGARTQGLNFTAPVLNYRESRPKQHLYRIEIATKTDEDTYSYVVEITDKGRADIRVRSEHRDFISFEGRM